MSKRENKKDTPCFTLGSGIYYLALDHIVGMQCHEGRKG